MAEQDKLRETRERAYCLIGQHRAAYGGSEQDAALELLVELLDRITDLEYALNFVLITRSLVAARVAARAALTKKDRQGG